MKRYLLIFIGACICGNLLATPETTPNHKDAPIENLSALEAPVAQSDDDEGITILTLFSGIIGNFANILTDPHNPTVVGPNLARVLAGIINIAMTATRRGDLSSNASPEEIIEYFKLHDVEKKVRTHLIRKSHQVRSNLYHVDQD